MPPLCPACAVLEAELELDGELELHPAAATASAARAAALANHRGRADFRADPGKRFMVASWP